MFNVKGQLSINVIEKPVVVITEIALQKMEVYVDACSKEVGWLGTVSKEDNLYFIEDVFLFEQEVHGATCELNEKSIANWTEDMLMNNPDGMEIVNSMRVWGHSHVNMEVSPSGQDEKQLSELASNSDDFFIRIIANKRGDLRLDFVDIQRGIQYNCLQWQKEVSSVIDREEIELEMKAKIKEKVYPQQTMYQYQKTYQQSSMQGESYWDRLYGEQTQQQTQKEKASQQVSEILGEYETLEDCINAEELIAEYGITEDELISFYSMTAYDLASYLKAYVVYGEVSYNEAVHVKDLVHEYLIKNYNGTDDLI